MFLNLGLFKIGKKFFIWNMEIIEKGYGDFVWG